MASKQVTFENASGQKLAARLEEPESGSPLAYALFAHCFTCSKDLKAVGNISRSLVREGVAVLRFDFTGLGESEGDFADTNFSSNVEDLVAAARFAESTFGPVRIIVGHSLGGAAVSRAAAAIPSCVAVATIGAPCDPAHVTHLLGSSREKIESEGVAQVSLAGRDFTIKKQFLDDLDETRMKEAIRNLNRALLVFHSPIDQTVTIENASRIFEAAKHPKSFVSLDRADHLLTNKADSEYVGSVIAAWAKKYIADGDEPSPSAGQPTDGRNTHEEGN